MKTPCRKITVLLLILSLSLCFTMSAFAGLETASASDAKEDHKETVSQEEPDDGYGLATASDAMPLDAGEGYGFTIRKLGPFGALPDAVFRLYKNDQDAYGDKDPMYFMVDVSETTYTSYDTSDSPAGGLAVNDIYAGRVNVKGLLPGYYYLAEVAAPKGYQRLPYIFEIKIDDEGFVYRRNMGLEADLTQVAGGLLNIENQAVQVLPGTGGTGNGPIYAAGIICIVAAFFAVLRSRKRR